MQADICGDEAAAQINRAPWGLAGGDFHVQLPNALHVFPQTWVATRCEGAQRILTR
jgi:hypothetical protein